MNANTLATFGAPLMATMLLACGGPQSPQSPPPSSPAGAPSDASSTSAAQTTAGTTAAVPEKKAEGPTDPATPVAKISLPAGERAITFGEVEAWANARRADKEPVRWPMTFDELAGRLLLADEAKRRGVSEPADELARAEAWAKQELLPAAEASITDADMQAAFTERRSAVRIMSRSEAEAKELRAQVVDKVLAVDNMQDKIKTFRTRGGKSLGPQRERDDASIAPTGALFDPQGKGDAGQAVVPPKVAETAFGLKAEGEISEPVEIANGRWVLVMLTGVRPGTPVDKVPPEVAARAKEGLVTTRAMAAMKERVARLRRESPVVILDDKLVQKALGLSAEDVRASRMRKLPFDTRKMRMDQLRGDAPSRVPGVEPRNLPPTDRATPEKVLEGGPK